MWVTSRITELRRLGSKEIRKCQENLKTMLVHILVSNFPFRNETWAKSKKENLAVVIRNYAKAD